jgi:hypothetical protein
MSADELKFFANAKKPDHVRPHVARMVSVNSVTVPAVVGKYYFLINVVDI